MTRRFSNDTLTTRAYRATFRAEEGEKGVIEGTPIVFGEPTRIQDWNGEYVEVIEPTAMRNTDMKDVRLFVNHDTSKIALARSKNGGERSTMHFDTDESGVHMRAVLDIDNNAEARALYSAIERGDMDGMSFMFRVKEEEWRDIDEEIPTRVIKDISIVHEVSVVNYPAYPQTSVSARGAEDGSPYSPLAEARRRHAEETAAIEVERLKNRNIISTIKKVRT